MSLTKLGYKIRELRLKKQMTQKDVVGEFMTRNMLSKIENGNATPSIKTLEYLAWVLGVPVSYFLQEAEEEEYLLAQNNQLQEIIALADSLLADREDGRAAYDCQVLSIALCIKARALLMSDEVRLALDLFQELNPAKWDAKSLERIYKTLEDAYKQIEDYKKAYDYATKRLELNR